MTPMFQKIVSRIAEAIVELGSELLADQTIDEPTRGIHALHLLQILTTARSHAPPDAEGFVVAGSPVVEPMPVRPVEPQQAAAITPTSSSTKPTELPSLKPVKTRKSGSGREFKFTDAEILATLNRFNGSVDRAAAFLKCVRNTVYRARARSEGTSPIIWNAANRSKLAEIVSRMPRPSIGDIGHEMGTSASAIQTAMSRYGFTRNNGTNVESLKQRKCLNCRTPFMSTHAGNRRCPRCIRADSEIAA